MQRILTGNNRERLDLMNPIPVGGVIDARTIQKHLLDRDGDEILFTFPGPGKAQLLCFKHVFLSKPLVPSPWI